MGHELLPQAVHISPGAAIRLNAWALVAVTVSFLARWSLSHHASWPAGVQLLVAVAPLVPGLLWARGIAQWIRTLDELQRRIQHDAWFFGSVGTVFVITALGLAGSAVDLSLGGIRNGLGWEGTFVLLFSLYAVGCVISNRRYQ